MKKLFLILSIILLINCGLFSQDNVNTTKTSNTFDIQGFSGVVWETKYSDVIQKYKTLSSDANVEDPVDIIKEIPDKRLLIKRNNIFYKFEFYKKNASKSAIHKTDSNDTKTDNTDVSSIPRFFFLESKFILVEANDLYNRLKEKYGKYTKNTVNRKTQRGAFIWDLPSGYIIQWVEPYEKKQFTRRIYYVSKKIKKEIEKDLISFQFEKEIKILKKLTP